MDAKDFDFQRIAEGYKRRPFLHKQIVERFQKDVTSEIFSNGLDIGCGAGLSSKALKAICHHVTGTDISKEMIAVAREVCASA
ncbi:MAG: class I SAM-dependent methyltransferase, partial [Lachnospiraceae bacterium]|nr:class I SAM-dependent methyltransferase [Lachnospiraceae bacterium]